MIIEVVTRHLRRNIHIEIGVKDLKAGNFPLQRGAQPVTRSRATLESSGPETTTTRCACCSSR